jgi:hypothetical protein
LLLLFEVAVLTVALDNNKRAIAALVVAEEGEIGEVEEEEEVEVPKLF